MKTPKPASRRTAYHEAGHAAISILFRLPFRRVTINPNMTAGTDGHVSGGTIPEWICALADDGDIWENPSATSRAIDTISMLKAGHIAERHATKRPDYDGASGDRMQAYDWLVCLASEEPHEELLALDRWLDLLTARLVKRHWKAIEAVAQALIERQSLSGQEVRRIVAKHDPRMVPAEPMSREERQQARTEIAWRHTTLTREAIRAEIQSMPPSRERRLWQEVGRDIKAGRLVVEVVSTGPWKTDYRPRSR